ncbi:uncharacterized protein [Branchiostoma lanceolatum]|uniref:uncharacterized protein n=1 Tax=Branchiostoma lanceolatum TaxID=7740 RepID=UPI003455C754
MTGSRCRYSSNCHNHGNLQTTGNINGYWRPYYIDTNQYLQVNFDDPRYIYGLETRGRPSSTWYVQTYELQYTEDGSNWQYFKDPNTGSNKVFTGNNDGNTIVSNNLDYSILAKQIRVRPKSWNNYIALAVRFLGKTQTTDGDLVGSECTANTGPEPGGPGTVVRIQTNAGTRNLEVDNKNRLPKIGLTASCQKYHIEKSGSAAWVTEASPSSFHSISLSNGGHLVIGTDISAQTVTGDDTSVLHVIPQKTFTLGQTLSARTYVESQGLLDLPYNLLTTFTKDVTVYGTIGDSADPALTVQGTLTVQPDGDHTYRFRKLRLESNSKVLLQNATNPGHCGTSLTISGTSVGNEEQLYVGRNAELSVTCTLTFNMTEMNIGGSGGTIITDAADWSQITTSFTVNDDATLIFDHAVTDISVPQINVGGTLESKSVLNIVCQSFNIRTTGTVTLDSSNGGSEESTLQAGDVTVDGRFEAKSLSAVDGWSILTVQEHGVFTLRAVGTYQIDKLFIDGKMETANSIFLKGKTVQRIRQLTVGPNAGKLYLDKDGRDAGNWTGISQVGVHKAVIQGEFLAGLLTVQAIASPQNGWDVLYMNESGLLEFDPHQDFSVDVIEINGTMKTFNPVVIHGLSANQIPRTLIGPSGEVLLDTEGGGQNDWRDVPSEIHTEEMVVLGTLHAGALDMGIGLDGLEVGGTYTFQSSSSEVLVNQVTIGGSVRILNPVLIRGRGDIDVQTFVMASGSSLTLDSGDYAGSTSTHRPYSELLMNSATVNGTLTGKDLSFSINSLDIGGTMTFDANSTEVDSFIIDDGGRVSVDNVMTMIGKSKNRTGQVLIAGTYAGEQMYLNVETITVTSTGVVSVDKGGHFGGQGPGAGTSYTSGASGASHGGRGGRGYSSNVLAKNLPYGDIFSKGTLGSGGGMGRSSRGGGRGGGLIHLDGFNFTLDGRITTDGEDATYTDAGGGSGGSLWVTCDRFHGVGFIFSNGGDGNRYGGGGAGGRVTIYYNTGNFKSGHIEAKGGTSSREPGGPGMAYMEGTNPVNKNLRVDNKCQQPTVTEPTGDRAGEEQFAQYIQTGAIAYLFPPEDDFEYEFTLIEVYGSAHLTVKGNRTTIRATQVLGDDTGHVHLPPYHTLHITEVSPYKRANITWAPYIYENATLILPTATIELRQPFDESQYNSDNCATARLRSSEVKIWGILDSSQAHVIVGSGGTLTMQLPSPRNLEMVGLTVQDGGTLQLNSHYGMEDDQWVVQVYPDEKEGKKRDGSVTLEGGGLLKARNLYLEAHTLTVDSAAVLHVSELGDIEGPGAGSSRAGAGYGGQGGRGSSSTSKLAVDLDSGRQLLT